MPEFDKNNFYQADYTPPAPRANGNPTPATKWGCDESFAALSAATRKAEKSKKLPRFNTIPMEVWEAIARANGGTLDGKDISAWKNILRGQELTQVNHIPPELWRAIEAMNGGTLSEEDISAWKNLLRGQDIGTIKQIVRGEPITLREVYQMPKRLANMYKLMETRQSSNEVGLDLIILDDVVHVSTTEEIDQLNEKFTGTVIRNLPPSDEEDEGAPYDSAAYHQIKTELIQQHMNGDPTAPMTLDDKACMDAWCRYMMELIEENAEDQYEYSVDEPVFFSQPMDLGTYLAYAWGVLAVHEAPLQDSPAK